MTANHAPDDGEPLALYFATRDDRQARADALNLAVQVSMPGTSATEVVGMAEQFRAFLVGPPEPEALPDCAS